MTKIQWMAFSLIIQALAILLYQLVGESSLYVSLWRERVDDFLKEGEKVADTES